MLIAKRDAIPSAGGWSVDLTTTRDLTAYGNKERTRQVETVNVNPVTGKKYRARPKAGRRMILEDLRKEYLG